MKIIECVQGSPEWHRARAGVITASVARSARAKLKAASGWRKAGEPTAEADKLAFRLAIERISGEPLDSGIETWEMRRGHELEPEARIEHQGRINAEVEQCGFMVTEDGLFGCSVDGLIGDDLTGGGAEYKCFLAPDKLFDILIRGDWSDVRDQVQFCLAVSGRAWWDSCLYAPFLKPINRHFTRQREQRDDDYIEALWRDMLAFNTVVEGYVTKLRAGDLSADVGITQKAA